MAKTIREVAKEVGTELSTGFKQSKGFLRKRVRQPSRNGPPLAFTILPPQYYRPLQKPRPIKRIKRRRR